MDTWRLLILSHGTLLLGALVLAGLVRRDWRHARHAETQSAARGQQVQTVRDALHAWLVEGTPCTSTSWSSGAGPVPMCRFPAPVIRTPCWSLPACMDWPLPTMPLPWHWLKCSAMPGSMRRSNQRRLL